MNLESGFRSFRNAIYQVALVFSFIITPTHAEVVEKPKKAPESANNLLRASQRLQLTRKQKKEITKIYNWAVGGCDWLSRDAKMDDAVRKKKCNEILAKSLETALKELTPKQRELWRLSQAPDPKVPKKEQLDHLPPTCFSVFSRRPVS